MKSGCARWTQAEFRSGFARSIEQGEARSLIGLETKSGANLAGGVDQRERGSVLVGG